MIQPHCPLRTGSFFQRTPVSKSSCSDGFEHWGGGRESSASLPSAALQGSRGSWQIQKTWHEDCQSIPFYR